MIQLFIVYKDYLLSILFDFFPHPASVLLFYIPFIFIVTFIRFLFQALGACNIFGLFNFIGAYIIIMWRYFIG